MAGNWVADIALFLKDEDDEDRPVFAFGIPQNVNFGFGVIPPIEGMPTDPEIPQHFKGRFDLVSRAAGPEEAYDNLAALVPLMTMGTTQWDNMLIKYCRPLHKPQVFPQSDGGHYEAVVGFMICFTETRI